MTQWGGSSSRQTGGTEMRRLSARFAAAIVMLSGLWLFSSPAPLFANPIPNDGNPHYAKWVSPSGACVDHVATPTSPEHVPASYTFTMCQGSSGATSWFAEVWKYPSGANDVPVCTWGDASHMVTATTPQTFPCNLPAGTYKAWIHYYVGNNGTLMHACDAYFKQP
jgi:hypothetical protein